MNKTTILTSSSLRRGLYSGCFLLTFLCLGTSSASAADDFDPIVHEIEARYHVHRNFRFLMGLAGITVRISHVGGAKNLKMALFEDQRFQATADELDQIVAKAGAHGWQPLVRSFDRRSGEHTFIYARDLGKDLRVLLVTVEANEAIVLELTVNQAKLLDFINRHQSHGARISRNHGHGVAREGEAGLQACFTPLPY